MYSLELLMMDGKTETCTVSLQHEINLIHWCILLVYYRNNTIHGSMNVKSIVLCYVHTI